MKTGDMGEEFAAKYLEKNGYKIVDRNFKCRFGEIDIIAVKDGYIVFAEVKTRAKNALVSGEESVDYFKQRRLISAAKYYLKISQSLLQPRFDVIVVEHSDNILTITNHIENAF